MDCLGPNDAQLKEPLVQRRDKGGCCGSEMNRGYQIWNGVLLLLGVVLVVEAAFCFAAGAAEEDALIAANAASAGAKGEYDWADVMLAIGICLASVGLTQIILGAFAIFGCCDKRKLGSSSGCCATCVHALYFTASSLLIAMEVVLALAMFVLQDWDNFKGSFNVDISDDADPSEKKDMGLVLCGFLVELILAIFVQVGAMVFHVTFNNAQEGEDAVSDSDSYGSESFTEKRLDNMRKYYAQLYVENGLQIPSELRQKD